VGSRDLGDGALPSELERGAFLRAIEEQLATRLEQLPSDLGLTRHFFCGISQIAVGADSVFTRVCATRGIPQRIFLPQHREAFLTAASDHGPDFSSEERERARDLLKSAHIVEERVVSDSAERSVRFEDVNLEIVRASDLLIALIRSTAAGRPGGSQHAIDVAKKRNLPVLEVHVAVRDGKLELSETWHGKERFNVPTLPAELITPTGTPPRSGSAVPSLGTYSDALRKHASGVANWQRRLFSNAAVLVIGAHLFATVLASVALALHGLPWLSLLLGLELCVLAFGFAVHQYLHRADSSRVWAVARVVAEILRSMRAVEKVHAHLDYLFALPYPPALRPLLRTLSVLHLRDSRATLASEWKPNRDLYVANRVTHQLAYFEHALKSAKKQLKRTRRNFLTCSALAFAATASKIAIIAGLAGLAGLEGHVEMLTEEILGVLAIALPVLAAGTLSLSAALDREARAHTFSDMHLFLTTQKLNLQQASSEREFVHLMLETEAHLLGENATWYTRRSFTGVT
jgi:hypothetical protein